MFGAPPSWREQLSRKKPSLLLGYGRVCGLARNMASRTATGCGQYPPGTTLGITRSFGDIFRTRKEASREAIVNREYLDRQGAASNSVFDAGLNQQGDLTSNWN